MKKKDITRSIKQEFLKGTSKTELFDKYQGMALSDKNLGYYLSGLKDPELLSKYKFAHVSFLIIFFLTNLLAMLNLAINYSTGILIFGLTLTLLIFIGIIRKSNAVYGIYSILMIINLRSASEGFMEEPITVGIILSINIGLISLGIYLKSKYYPDMGLLSPKKIKGKFNFQT